MPSNAQQEYADFSDQSCEEESDQLPSEAKQKIQIWFDLNIIHLIKPRVLLYGDVIKTTYRDEELLWSEPEGIDKAKFSHLVRSAFNRTYLKMFAQGNKFAIIATFFGLPSGDLNAKNVLKNMVDWKGAYSYSKNVFQAIPHFIINLFSVILQTLLNIVKLFTEFFPLAIKNLLNKAIYDLWKHKSRSFWTSVVKAMGLFVLSIFYTAFKGLHLVGQAMTAPIHSMELAFSYTGWFFPLNVISALLSLALTVTVYFVLSPLVFAGLFTIFPSLAAFSWLSFVGNIVPAFIANLIGSIGGTFGIAGLAFVGASVMGIALVALGTIVGGTVDAIGSSIPDENTFNPKKSPIYEVNQYFSSPLPGCAMYLNTRENREAYIGELEKSKCNIL